MKSPYGQAVKKTQVTLRHCQRLPIIRQLLLEEKNQEAEKEMHQYFKCKGEGSAQGNGANARYGCFQTLGNLRLDYYYS